MYLDIFLVWRRLKGSCTIRALLRKNRCSAFMLLNQLLSWAAEGRYRYRGRSLDLLLWDTTTCANGGCSDSTRRRAQERWSRNYAWESKKRVGISSSPTLSYKVQKGSNTKAISAMRGSGSRREDPQERRVATIDHRPPSIPSCNPQTSGAHYLG
jgi:hypothetical protein